MFWRGLAGILGGGRGVVSDRQENGGDMESRNPAESRLQPGVASRPGIALLASARWLLLACLVAAPWAYGSTRPVPREWLGRALVVVTIFFVLGLLLSRRGPRIPVMPCIASILLLAQGWIMTLNPVRYFDGMQQIFYDRLQRIEWLPGTVDRATSWSQMMLMTGLLGAFWICCDFQKNPVWRKRFWNTIALTGVSILALGLAQRTTQAEAIFWEWGENSGRTFFSTFRYHANAGAFVNLVVFPIVAKAFVVFQLQKGQLEKVFWTVAAAMSSACMFLHSSRAASAIGAVLLTGFFLVVLVGLRRRGGLFRVLGVCFLGALLVALLTWAAGYHQLETAWSSKANLLKDNRYMVYLAIMQNALPDAGLWGFGPGTFSIIFPFYKGQFGVTLPGYWATAHQDYLQTLVEWGWIGGGLWMIVLPGALLRGVGKTLLSSGRGREGGLFQTAACFSLAGILLHAGVDFPLQIASLQLYALCLAGVLWGVERDRILSQGMNWK